MWLQVFNWEGITLCLYKMGVCVCVTGLEAVYLLPLRVCRFTTEIKHWVERRTDLPISTLLSFGWEQTKTFHLQTLSHTFVHPIVSFSHYKCWAALFLDLESFICSLKMKIVYTSSVLERKSGTNYGFTTDYSCHPSALRAWGRGSVSDPDWRPSVSQTV